MKTELLKATEELFLAQYERESLYIKHNDWVSLDKLTLGKSMSQLKRLINERLVPFKIELYQYNGIAYEKNKWESIFICNSTHYDFVINELDDKTTDEDYYDLFDDPQKILNFIDLIHEPQENRISSLYNTLLSSEFYTVTLPMCELKNKLDCILPKNEDEAQTKDKKI